MIRHASPHVLLAGSDVHRHHAAVHVLLAVGANRVSEPTLLAHLAEEPRRGRAAEDRIQDSQGEAPLVRARDPAAPEADVVLLGVLDLERESRRCAVFGRLGNAIALGGRRPQLTLRQLDDSLVFEVPRRGEHQIRPGVTGVVVGHDLGDGDRADHLRVAQHPAPQRVVAMDCGRQHVVDPLLGLVLVHGDFLKHHLALRIDLVLGQRRAKEHLGEQVEGLFRVLVQKARVQLGGLLAGRRVGCGAHAVEQLRDLDRRVPLGALEQQVLEEVRDARLLGGLIP